MNRYENFLLRILQQSKGATAIYDTADIRIAFANKAMLEIWGRDEEIIGQCFSDVFPDFTGQGFTEILKNVWTAGETYEVKEYSANVTINEVTTLKYFDFIYQAVLDEDGKTYAIIHSAVDVSSRRQALEGLTPTLWHDLKNPLSIAKMGAQYMQSKKTLTDADRLQWATVILEAISSMEHIIELNSEDEKG